jgi:hypothetical protein
MRCGSSLLLRPSLRLLLLAPLCLAQGGCLGLIRTILYPVETAQAAGTELAYNVASDLAGGADQTALATENLANVERMIQDHPDAANMASLERLRDHLREEVGAGQGKQAQHDGLRDPKSLPGAVEATDKVYPVPPPEDEFERRALDFLGDPLERNVVSWPGRPDHVQNDLQIEFSGRSVDQLRVREDRRFTVRPRQSSFSQHLRDYPTLFLDGEVTRSAPLNQHLLQNGRILQEEDRVGYQRDPGATLAQPSPDQRH